MNRTEDQYNITIEPIERRYENTNNIENQNTKGYFELNLLADLVVDYDESYYPM